MKSSVFWDITLCSRLKVNQRFAGTCHMHIRDRRLSQAKKKKNPPAWSRLQAEPEDINHRCENLRFYIIRRITGFRMLVLAAKYGEWEEGWYPTYTQCLLYQRCKSIGSDWSRTRDLNHNVPPYSLHICSSVMYIGHKHPAVTISAILRMAVEPHYANIWSLLAARYVTLTTRSAGQSRYLHISLRQLSACQLKCVRGWPKLRERRY
jgi:hypothetical protein